MKVAKQYCISKNVVMDAWRKVKSNSGSAGIDGKSVEDFEKNLKNNLYKIWNRMSSGTYFPPPVLTVSIPKKSGGIRKLGIPTVSDRVAQMVAKSYFEPMVEPSFHEDSYGYRFSQDFQSLENSDSEASSWPEGSEETPDPLPDYGIYEENQAQTW